MLKFPKKQKLPLWIFELFQTFIKKLFFQQT